MKPDNLLLLMIFVLVLPSCKTTDSTESTVSSLSCRGTFYDRNAYGALRKWDEQSNSQGTACLLDNKSLSSWEQSAEDRRGQNVTCTPQALDVSLVSSGNYYAYRDDRVYVDLDGTSGSYRRIFLGELKDGRQSFTREQGCFYVRDGAGVDSSFGRQILMDTTSIAATEPFVPAEIFRVDQAGSNFLLTRFDDMTDWGYAFCPDLRTPWNYCTDLRNGNLMYYPDLSAAIQTSLTNEAILIRTAFSFASISRLDFDLLWSGVSVSHVESPSSNWKFAVSHVVDTPRFTDGAWREYVMGTRPTMPVVGSSNQLPICFDARRSVTVTNGSTAIVSGEVCYANGEYIFTQE